MVDGRPIVEIKVLKKKLHTANRKYRFQLCSPTYLPTYLPTWVINVCFGKWIWTEGLDTQFVRVCVCSIRRHVPTTKK